MASDGATIFLSESQAHRIRSTVAARKQLCKDLFGRPREHRDAQAAISQATGASLMADMGNASSEFETSYSGHGGSVPVLIVGDTYSPCRRALAELEQMRLSELKHNTHHRGRLLRLRRVAPVVTLAARSWTMVQDDNDQSSDTERLEISLHNMRAGEDVLDSAREFIIKEPFFTITEEGEPTLRIDHPSDLRLSQLPGGLLLEKPTDTCSESGATEDAVRVLKEKGNRALREDELLESHVYYTSALQTSASISGQALSDSFSALVKDIHRNRSQVNILLGRFDQAFSDANAALTEQRDPRSLELDAKAWLRAGTSAYSLGDYQEARASFQKRMEILTDDKDSQTFLRRITAREHERATGQYDMARIRRGISRHKPNVDVASHVEGTAVRESQGRGRGLFATKDFPAGSIVMSEKALCVSWAHTGDAMTAMTYDVRDDNIRASAAGLTRLVVRRLLDRPSQAPAVMALYGDYGGDGSEEDCRADEPAVDVFRVQDIISRNAFSPGMQFGPEQARSASTGLWVRAAYINHSCVPNAQKDFVGDVLQLRALRAIRKGDELFHSYEGSVDYDTRQASLLKTWGFNCRCALCRAESVDPAVVRTRRRELHAEAQAFLAREKWSDAKRLTISKAKRIERALMDTYDAERYANLPRTAVSGIQEWLSKATPRR